MLPRNRALKQHHTRLVYPAGYYTTSCKTRAYFHTVVLRHHDHSFLPQLSTSLGKLPRFECSDKDMPHQLQHFSMRFHLPAIQVYHTTQHQFRYQLHTSWVIPASCVMLDPHSTDQCTCTYSVLNSSCKLLIQLRQYFKKKHTKKRDNSGVTDIDETKNTAVVVDYEKSSPVYDKKGFCVINSTSLFIVERLRCSCDHISSRVFLVSNSVHVQHFSVVCNQSKSTRFLTKSPTSSVMM